MLAAVSASRCLVASTRLMARARLTCPRLIASRTAPARSGSQAASHTRRWHAVTASPVATWISRAATERHERKKTRQPREARLSGARWVTSLSSSPTSTAVAVRAIESAHALTASTASTTVNA